jgi:hypothetical protein
MNSYTLCWAVWFTRFNQQIEYWKNHHTNNFWDHIFTQKLKIDMFQSLLYQPTWDFLCTLNKSKHVLSCVSVSISPQSITLTIAPPNQDLIPLLIREGESHWVGSTHCTLNIIFIEFLIIEIMSINFILIICPMLMQIKSIILAS